MNIYIISILVDILILCAQYTNIMMLLVYSQLVEIVTKLEKERESLKDVS